MAGHLGRKLIFGLGGIALFMIWTSVAGSDDAATRMSTVPAVVFEGGGGTLGLTFTTNQPADLVFGFEQYDESTDESRVLEGSERFEPGTYTRTIDVTPSTYIYLELGVPDATPGAELSWSIGVDGRGVLRDADRLDEPLGQGYAFFLQVEADDIADMRSWR